MATKKVLNFAALDHERFSTNPSKYRKSTYPTEDPEQDGTSRSSYEEYKRSMSRTSNFRRSRAVSNIPNSHAARLTQMFADLRVGRPRDSSIVLPPVQTLLATYWLESKNVFDPRRVEDFLEKYLNVKIESQGKFPFGDAKAMNTCTRTLAEEILFQVKLFDFDRFKIFVSLTIAEKQYQGYNQSVAFFWDVETDVMASYVCERGGFWVTCNVFGIYFD